jgi:two-component system, NarL family, response regulator DevR
MKILVVDRHPVMRLGLLALLRAEDDILTIRVAESMDDAVSLVATERPDIVILDFILKGQQSGTELCRQIKSVPNPPGVVVYTDNDAEVDLFLCQLSGADSYVHKNEEPGRLLEAIRATLAGKRVWFIGSDTAPDPNRQQTVHQHACLTPRERQIFSFMLKRYTNSHIAKELGISTQTVKNHSSNVLRKLGVNRRTDLPCEQPSSFRDSSARRLNTRHNGGAYYHGRSG